MMHLKTLTSGPQVSCPTDPKSAVSGPGDVVAEDAPGKRVLARRTGDSGHGREQPATPARASASSVIIAAAAPTCPHRCVIPL